MFEKRLKYVGNDVDLWEGHSPSRLSESELRHFCLFRVD